MEKSWVSNPMCSFNMLLSSELYEENWFRYTFLWGFSSMKRQRKTTEKSSNRKLFLYCKRHRTQQKKVRQWSRRGNGSFNRKNINFNCTFSTFVNISLYFWYLSTNFAKYFSSCIEIQFFPLGWLQWKSFSAFPTYFFFLFQSSLIHLS